MSLAERLKKARTDARLTQRELAEISSVSQQNIQKIESGKSQETSFVLELAKATGKNPYWLKFGLLPESDASKELIGDRLRKARKKKGLTQDQLLNLCGLDSGTNNSRISHYENNARKPTTEAVRKLAEVLEVSEAWLQYGSYYPVNGIDQITIPVLTWQQAVYYPNLPEKLDDYIPVEDYVDCCYALVINSDTMRSEFPDMRNLQPGTTIIVDAKKELINGDVVVVLLPGDEEAILRQYTTEGSTVYLKPYSRAYPTIEMPEGTKILGVVVEDRYRWTQK